MLERKHMPLFLSFMCYSLHSSESPPHVIEKQTWMPMGCVFVCVVGQGTQVLVSGICGLTWQLILLALFTASMFPTLNWHAEQVQKLASLIIHGGVNWSMDLLSLECEEQINSRTVKKILFQVKICSNGTGVLQMAVNPCLASLFLLMFSRLATNHQGSLGTAGYRKKSCLIGLWHCSLPDAFCLSSFTSF